MPLSSSSLILLCGRFRPCLSPCLSVFVSLPHVRHTQQTHHHPLKSWPAPNVMPHKEVCIKNHSRTHTHTRTHTTNQHAPQYSWEEKLQSKYVWWRFKVWTLCSTTLILTILLHCFHLFLVFSHYKPLNTHNTLLHNSTWTQAKAHQSRLTPLTPHRAFPVKLHLCFHRNNKHSLNVWEKHKHRGIVQSLMPVFT